MKLPFLKGQRGQTSVEYVLILSVSVGLGLTFFKKLDGWFLTNPNSYVGKQLNSLKKVMGQDPKYKRFSVPR